MLVYSDCGSQGRGGLGAATNYLFVMTSEIEGLNPSSGETFFILKDAKTPQGWTCQHLLLLLFIKTEVSE